AAYPGKGVKLNPTPKGLRRLSPALPSAATLGWTTQPLQGCGTFNRLPRVAADGNPGLDDATPSGLHSALSTQHAPLSTQDSALSTQDSGLRTQHSLPTQDFISALRWFNLSRPVSSRARALIDRVVEASMHRRGRVGLLALVVLGIVLSAAPTLARLQPSAPAQSAPASTAADSAVGTAQAQSGQRSITERLMENGRVINMIDDLLGFWAQARNQPLARQRWFWRRTVERKYADYFERAVYRGADEATRRAILDDYLTRAPERLEALAHFNQLITDPGVSPLVQELIDFRVWFRDFRPKTDIYIGPSLFRFDGAIRPLGNKDGVPDTLCLGAEVLADYEPDQLRMTLAHELFHLYHFGFLFDHASPEDFKTAHIPLMIEGMAVAATELLYPTLDRRIHLHFDD